MPTSLPDETGSPRPHTFAEGLGCALLVMGVPGLLIGLTGLLGLSDRVELEFFEIELNSTPGRFVWVVGMVIAIVVGVVLLKRGGPERRDEVD